MALSAGADWRLKRATAADAAALSLVASACFLETFAGLLEGPDIVAHCAKANHQDAFRDWAEASETRVVVAEIANGAAPIGYSVLTTPNMPAVETRPADIELRRIYTLSRVHGTGLGSALMAQALLDARAMGRERMLLGVYAGNERARAFYEKQGFAKVGERQYQVGATLCDDVIYALQL
ncbi:GNAT family N-acetyltransferase [Sphingomonas asaccharolytica]|uniref:GNAT family N-acetyltransferase n=1 Tax=Sphingomonas asaccharolytica TaxID=40681 RepID=UPI0008370911|nr:GNAT family N-acetyltransferase [Sphingomonas asaccharolytica]